VYLLHHGICFLVAALWQTESKNKHFQQFYINIVVNFVHADAGVIFLVITSAYLFAVKKTNFASPKIGGTSFCLDKTQ